MITWSCCFWALAPDTVCVFADDPHRDYYLGHSVKAAVGRWQNGERVRQRCRHLTLNTQELAAVITLASAAAIDLRCKKSPLAQSVPHSPLSRAPGKDILWYTREKGTDEEEKARQELLAVKQREEDLMAEVSWVQS